jgi:hypothetical protein
VEAADCAADAVACCCAGILNQLIYRNNLVWWTPLPLHRWWLSSMLSTFAGKLGLALQGALGCKNGCSEC